MIGMATTLTVGSLDPFGRECESKVIAQEGIGALRLSREREERKERGEEWRKIGEWQ
jgi:hypothetical protein